MDGDVLDGGDILASLAVVAVVVVVVAVISVAVDWQIEEMVDVMELAFRISSLDAVWEQPSK